MVQRWRQVHYAACELLGATTWHRAIGPFRGDSVLSRIELWWACSALTYIRVGFSLSGSAAHTYENWLSGQQLLDGGGAYASGNKTQWRLRLGVIPYTPFVLQLGEPLRGGAWWVVVRVFTEGSNQVGLMWTVVADPYPEVPDRVEVVAGVGSV